MQPTLILLLAAGWLTQPDLCQLQEVLHDRQDPRGQSQAALMLLQSADPAAETLIRQGLKQVDNEETFLALAGAARLRLDDRFLTELLAALAANKIRVRQAAAETLAVLPHPELVKRLTTLVHDARGDARLRQTALWTLGRCGRKDAVDVLIGQLTADSDEMRRVASAALIDLTGQSHGLDAARWAGWWAKHKDQSAEHWLQLRLGFQAMRAQRLEGDLMRARSQVLRLHQQLYSRLPVAERFAYLQTLLEQEDASVRGLAVVWAVELLPAADVEKQKAITKLLLRLTHDGTLEVQRAAVLALGRLTDAAACERLEEMLGNATPSVRAVAVRALSLQTRGTTAEARARLKKVVPLLQTALDDKALDVVVEAAEALGVLGAPEAGPVLIGLLKHTSEHVRQTAAQALERTADAGLLDGLLRGLDDKAVTVRFGLVGALGKAAGNGQALATEARKRLVDRLEGLLKSDADDGVRSRAATVLGECGTVDQLGVLWQQVHADEDRVQQKAWDAMVEIITRAGTVALVQTWDKKLTEAKQDSRRVQLWAKVYSRWEQTPGLREQSILVLEGLAQVQLDLGKWSAAAPLWQTILSRSADPADAGRTRAVQALARIAELALKENQRTEALRIIQDVRGYLGKEDKLAETFDALHKQATKE